MWIILKLIQLNHDAFVNFFYDLRIWAGALQKISFPEKMDPNNMCVQLQKDINLGLGVTKNLKQKIVEEQIVQI